MCFTHSGAPEKQYVVPFVQEGHCCEFHNFLPVYFRLEIKVNDYNSDEPQFAPLVEMKAEVMAYFEKVLG